MKGKAPSGMWWVAWRQHRTQIAVTLALVIGALVIFREIVIARFAAEGCDLASIGCAASGGYDLWWSGGFGSWLDMLHSAVVVTSIAFPVFVGAPLFAREFARGTHVFALTQSVSRRRWWATEVIVAGVPLLGGLVALGHVTEWVDGTAAYSAHQGLDVGRFVARSIMPAAHGLIAYAVAVAAGIVTRSTVAALVSGLIVSGLIVTGMAVIQPHTLPASRQVIGLEQQLQGAPPPNLGPDSWPVGGGYLDAKDNETGNSPDSCFEAADAAAVAVGIAGDGATAEVSPDERSSPAYQNAYQQGFLGCAHARDVFALYTDYLPGTMLWPLRWTMAGIAAILAALFLLLAATRLRGAAARR